MEVLRPVRGLVLAMLLLGGSWQAAVGKDLQKASGLARHVVAGIASSILLGGGVFVAEAHVVSPEQQEERLHKLQQAEQQAMLSHHSGSMSGSEYGQPPPSLWNQRLGANDEEDNELAWSEEVTHGSPVFYIALRNPDYEHMHHVTYVGDTALGEPMFAGLFLDGHEEDYIILYAQDGLVTQGFAQRDVKIFPDPLDLYAKLTVFTIKEFSLRGRYSPAVPEMFPVDEVGKKLTMVQYAKHKDDPEKLCQPAYQAA